MITNAELSALIRRNPISFGCGLVAVVLGVALFYRSSGVPELTALLEEKSREGSRLAANLRNGALLPEQLEEITAAARAIEGRLVRASELAQNLQYFYRLEAETGVKLLELRQLPPASAAKTAAGALTGIAFGVSLQGEYFAVLEFVRRLENGAHFSRVVTSSLSGSGPDRTAPVKLALDLELLGQP